MTAPASRYGAQLLAALGENGCPVADDDPVVRWAGSGAMALTGRPDGPPLVTAGPAVAVDGALAALTSLAPAAALPGLELLGERAALAGFSRRGHVSCGGATRLLPAVDGTVALSLARVDDVALVPALVEGAAAEPWSAVAAWLQAQTTAQARERAELLGLPLGVLGEAEPSPYVVSHECEGAPTGDRPLVVDLSSLWAGPLCASLLRALGCRVVKVEDPGRPDGARRGSTPFFDLLNRGSEPLSIELRKDAGRLRELMLSADVVIEGSRPRALAQHGIVAEEVVAEAPGLTWISITGHGRGSSRVGFGDDCAVAGGLAEQGCFVGDAVADPLTGVHAALAAWVGVRRGGSRLVDVALSRVAASAAAAWTPDGRTAVEHRGSWWVEGATGLVAVADPHARRS